MGVCRPRAMRTLMSLMVGAVILLSSAVFAGEPLRELIPREAARLVALRSGSPVNSIEICYVVEGSAKACDGFEARHVRRVAAIQSVREEGVERRRLVFYDFFWNDSLGWFTWQSAKERTGEVMYLWSELKGAIVIR